ncbi:MAG: DEAD/DEAH box helicase, partial [Beijerinckiaceae bacterium]
MPETPESYVHRIGRTARAGAEGQAISLCAPDERGDLRAIERLIRQEIPAESRGVDLNAPIQPRASRQQNRQRQIQSRKPQGSAPQGGGGGQGQSRPRAEAPRHPYVHQDGPRRDAVPAARQQDSRPAQPRSQAPRGGSGRARQGQQGGQRGAGGGGGQRNAGQGRGRFRD